MPEKYIETLLQTALKAADAATTVIESYRNKSYEVKVKADATPVTEVDVAVEKMIREVIHEHFPEHGFYGEETGMEGIDSETVWLVDPIDGTKSYVRGYPMYSTQIAVMFRGELVVGVSDASHFNQRAWACLGGGAWMNGQPIYVSQVDTLSQANLSSGNIASLACSDQWDAYGQLLTEVSRTRGYGDFYHYHLLATGAVDIVLESDVNILDVAALSVIVEQAGGLIEDLRGKPIGLDTRSVLAAANPQLLKQVRVYIDA